MWVVAKIKFNERAIFKKELSDVLNGNVVTITPASNQFYSYPATVTVSDGSLNDSENFQVTVK